MEPVTATPRDEPICLLVEATAPATPACSIGMPDTAVLVIGALTSPHPMPKMTYATSRYATEVFAVSRASSSAPIASAGPASRKGGRAPHLPTIRPETVEKMAIMAAIGIVGSPAESAL